MPQRALEGIAKRGVREQQADDQERFRIEVEEVAGVREDVLVLQEDDERFYAALIKVQMTAPKEIFAQGPQAEITVTDRRTKKVVKRERIADLYVGGHGWTIVPVWVPSAACGPFEIVASGGGRKLTRSLQVTCGE